MLTNLQAYVFFSFLNSSRAKYFLNFSVSGKLKFVYSIQHVILQLYPLSRQYCKFSLFTNVLTLSFALKLNAAILSVIENREKLRRKPFFYSSRTEVIAEPLGPLESMLELSDALNAIRPEIEK